MAQSLSKCGDDCDHDACFLPHAQAASKQDIPSHTHTRRLVVVFSVMMLLSFEIPFLNRVLRPAAQTMAKTCWNTEFATLDIEPQATRDKCLQEPSCEQSCKYNGRAQIIHHGGGAIQGQG